MIVGQMNEGWTVVTKMNGAPIRQSAKELCMTTGPGGAPMDMAYRLRKGKIFRSFYEKNRRHVILSL